MLRSEVANSRKNASEAKAGAELSLYGITKKYSETAAVDNLDLCVAPGEFVTLLGSSGSGKSTTLMMLAGFIAPTSGRITIAGKDVTRLEPARRNLGVVFQHYSLFPHMTVAQNVAFPLEMRKLPKHIITDKVSTALSMVQLSDKQARYPRELSGGQQQRVALARALIFGPQALLMDEPLGALDKNLREHMQLKIKRLHTELGATVVFVTHDQEEALTMSDRIAVMQHGRIAQIATPTEIYSRPVNRWVAEFIGQSNLLAGTVSSVESDGRYCVELKSGERLSIDGIKGLKRDDAVYAVLRPETIRLDASDMSGNRVQATVNEVLYLGHTVKLTASLADGTTLQVQAQNTLHGAPVHPGQAVTLYWPSDALWLIGAAS
ncbi:ABC transporter ATP-binding protein [Paraburkholderia tropica]|uniref:ABC transporter ATP-binding protein n=1 Tax=Paraburkholderia tropica TaxID=92647 RepID=UPI002AB69D64|nr:ABC transporter ATP-binding protein [Paraburkholderia tropica]